MKGKRPKSKIDMDAYIKAFNEEVLARTSKRKDQPESSRSEKLGRLDADAKMPEIPPGSTVTVRLVDRKRRM